MKTVPDPSGLAALDATETVAGLSAGRFSAVERLLASLDRIAVVQPALNAFTAIFSEQALAEATTLDRRIADGGAVGPLAGVPVAIKDFTPSLGHSATRGSWAVSDMPSTFDPVVVRRLKAAGAIIVGRTTTPEFAYSSFTKSPRWGITRNPWHPSLTAGGSSGGAAVAVATGCVPLAEGTDMGGSVRIPAALCGVVGLKPSLGRIPMDILPGCFDDMSHFGPLAGNLRDTLLFLAVTQGPDDADILSQTVPAKMPDRPADLRGKRFALSMDLGYYAIEEGVRAAVQAAVDALQDAGARIVPVTLPWTRRVNDLWTGIWGVTLAAAWGDRLATCRDEMHPHLVALIEAAMPMDAISFKRLETERSTLWRDRLLAIYETVKAPSTGCADYPQGSQSHPHVFVDFLMFPSL